MFHLVCRHPFQHHVTGKKYERGDMVTDAAEVASLSSDREHHFSRVAAPKKPLDNDDAHIEEPSHDE
jgi:hypothetical protein